MHFPVLETIEHLPASRYRKRREALQEKVLKAMVEHGMALHTLVEAKVGPSRKSTSRLAFQAAYLLLILQHGSDDQKARCRPLIQRIRRMKFARETEAGLTDQEFLEHVIQQCAGNGGRRAVK